MELSLNSPGHWQLLSAFAFGFLSSFTPCVFPLIPITLSLFGVRGDLSVLKRFSLSVTYVAGICFMYTALGIVSARSGAVFGGFLGNPAVVGILIVFLVLVAMFTLDMFQVAALSKLQTAAGKVGGKGYPGAFLMGMASGVVAAPCIGPALVVILGIAAASQSAAWGALLLLVYSLGLGLIFILLGTFSGLIQALPRAGNWMYAVKFVMAAALFMIALFIGERYFTGNVLALERGPDTLWLSILGAAALGAAFFAFKKNLAPLKLAAAAAAAVCAYEFILPQVHGAQWVTSYDEVLRESKAQNKPAMLDLYADWCAACKEFERITFPELEVQAELRDFVVGRIDFTDTMAPEALRLTEKYSVPGLPCLLFLKPDGEGSEIPDTRITGFLEPKEFAAHLRSVKAR